LIRVSWIFFFFCRAVVSPGGLRAFLVREAVGDGLSLNCSSSSGNRINNEEVHQLQKLLQSQMVSFRRRGARRQLTIHHW
jgi:hypothetical protein